ncbi:MAG: CpaD family pilus assembly protein [Pseudomonadota bacterium]
MPIAKHSKLAGAVAVSLGLTLAGCGGVPTNTSLYSIKQPVVERTNFALDVQTDRSGLTVSEQQRVDGWFESMDLSYGDRISIDDPSNSPAFKEAVEKLAGRYGLLVTDTAPTTEGFLQPGEARIVITRSDAHVPGCPDWSEKSDTNYLNGTADGYGCAVNSNLAAMVADPEDLIEGKADTSEVPLDTAVKAVNAYRNGNGGGN